jgi:glycosyltransferase involved in cell wall biosynthesis
MLNRLQVIGPFRGTSGYDRHTREFVRAFVDAGVAVELVPIDGWSLDLPSEQREWWFETLTAPVGADTVLQFTMGEGTRSIEGMRNINYTMFEADRIPQSWVRVATRQDCTIVPTQAARDAWVASGVAPDSVRVSPLGVKSDYFSVPSEPLPLVLPDGRAVSHFSRRFLNVAELRPRKNHIGLLRAWLRATNHDDDAVLIIKASVFEPHALSHFRAELASAQQSEGRSLSDAAPILVLTGFVSDQQLRALYRTATHYISMSHGEGWDLVTMEAAVAGLKLIAPKHTAYAEYLREDEVAFIPAPLAPVTFEGRMAGAEDRMLFDGVSWWNPDEDVAANVIRSVIDGDDGITGKAPGARLATEFAWPRVARKLLDVIGESA